jgi:PAS domain S-box-containing protein
LGHGWGQTSNTADVVRAAFDALPCAAAIIAEPADPSMVHANDAFCDLVGWSLNDIATLPLGELPMLETPADARRLAAVARAGPGSRQARVTLVHRDGSRKQVDISASRVHVDDAPPHVVLMVRPHGDIPMEERELREFERFLELSPDAVVGIAPDGAIAIVNAAVMRLFGYERAELVGLPAAMLVPELDRAGSTERVATYFRESARRVPGQSMFGRRSDGSEFPVEVSLSTIETSHGPIALASVRDIGGRLAAESAVREQAYRREIVSALLGVEEAERSRIATSLHDDTIQVLTASLLALDRLARAAARDPGLAETAEAISNTRAVLDEATERTRRLTFELRPTVLHERGIAAAIRALAESLRQETAIEPDLDVTPERYNWAVEELVYRTIQEAVANVRKHADAHHLIVAVHSAGTRVIGEVTDDGRGFDLEQATDREQMAFHQGLDAMTERVRMAGGLISIESEPGRGTRVRFELPVVDP